MSMYYSVADGYGVYLKDINKYLDKTKVIKNFKSLLDDPKANIFTNSVQNSKTVKEVNDAIEVFLVATFNMRYFELTGKYQSLCGVDNIYDLICRTSNYILDYMETGDDGIVIFLPRYYPWELTENHPKTKEEVIKLFTKSLSLVYDVDEEIIKSVIDEGVFEVTYS